MAMKYEISEGARADIDEIYEYSLLEYGRAQADRYYDGLIYRIESIAQSPRIARERTEFTPPVRIHPHGRHLIVYSVRSNNVLVARILHQAMDIADHI